MKIGVISDIHSNIVAFKECVKYMEQAGCDEYFFLGDYVSDTSYTTETLDYLYEFISCHKCFLLRGNREDYMLNQRRARLEGIKSQIWIENSASGNLLYTYEQLREKDFEFFESLPITFLYEKAGYPSIRCCHGSPSSSKQLLQHGSDEMKQWLAEIPETYLLCAHTHYPGESLYNGKHYYNSGSVGIAIDDAGFAQCMILEDGIVDDMVVWKPQFLKIPYDNHKVIADIIDSGLLEKAPWFVNSNIHTLLTGEDRSAEMVSQAAELSEKKNPAAVWPLVDEECFEIAAANYGVPDYRKVRLDV